MQLDLMPILQEAGEPETHEAVSPFWESSLASLPLDGVPFLKPDAFEEAAQQCGLESSGLPQLREAAARIEADEGLSALIWHGYMRLAEHPLRDHFREWPRLEQALGEHFGAFYLLIALAMIPRIIALHQRLGWPADVTRDTCRVVPAIYSNHVRFEGRIGVPRRQLYWIQHHVAGELVRIGRMEWMKRRFPGEVHVFRHIHTGRTVALAEGGMRVNPLGLYHWHEDPEPEGTWTTRFQRENHRVRGHLIHPEGVALPEMVSLDLNTWSHRLSRGTPTLDLHIPPGGGMTIQRCHQSMRNAQAFFDHHISDWRYTAFGCSSWIFNTQLQDILSPDSNLVQFQKQVYLFPVATRPTNGFFFIFGQENIDWNAPPRHTSLQRRIVDYLQQGHRWHGGGMFYLPEDLDRFGEHPYQETWNLEAIQQLATS